MPIAVIYAFLLGNAAFATAVTVPTLLFPAAMVTFFSVGALYMLMTTSDSTEKLRRDLWS